MLIISDEKGKLFEFDWDYFLLEFVPLLDNDCSLAD